MWVSMNECIALRVSVCMSECIALRVSVGEHE